MAFPISPGVSIREIDLTTGTPAVATSIAAGVGQFVWGPADDITSVSYTHLTLPTIYSV